jgi:hypothetical protein
VVVGFGVEQQATKVLCRFAGFHPFPVGVANGEAHCWPAIPRCSLKRRDQEPRGGRGASSVGGQDGPTDALFLTNSIIGPLFFRRAKRRRFAGCRGRLVHEKYFWKYFLAARSSRSQGIEKTNSFSGER